MNEIFCNLGKVTQSLHQTKSGHFAPAHSGGSNKLKAYLFIIYGLHKLVPFCTLIQTLTSLQLMNDGESQIQNIGFIVLGHLQRGSFFSPYVLDNRLLTF